MAGARGRARLPLLAAVVLALLRAPELGGVEALEVRVADVMKTSFIEQLQDPRYVVALRPGPASTSASAGDDAEAEAEAEVVVMTDKDGHKYRCTLPPPAADPSDPISAQDGVSEAGAREKSPAEFLQLLSSTCFYRVEGWWTYELCYMKKIRQYHQEKSQVTSEFILGEFDAEASEALEAEFVKSGESEAKYFPQSYTGGTPCDLTQTPRQTEVRFVCGAEKTNVLNSIKEPSTCSYVIVFTTPLLCKHSSFRKKAVQATPIYCDSLGGGRSFDVPAAAPGATAGAGESLDHAAAPSEGAEGASQAPEHAHEAAMKASMAKVAQALATVFGDAVEELSAAGEERRAPAWGSRGPSDEAGAEEEGEEASAVVEEEGEEEEAGARDVPEPVPMPPPLGTTDSAAEAEIRHDDYDRKGPSQEGGGNPPGQQGRADGGDQQEGAGRGSGKDEL